MKGTFYLNEILCSDLKFGASINTIACEGGKAVFIDTACDIWNI